MIEFLSFFLVLTTGEKPVELAVAGPVAEVELRLDGHSVATLRGEPWSILTDLGPELAPRELVAIARDREGRELDRITQWINVGTQSSGATMSFETDPKGRTRQVGLEWESIGRRQPQAIEVEFDGVALDVSDPKRVPLPPYDEKSLHFVSAVVHFDDRHVTRLDAAFGGVYSDAIATELTAVPVIVARGARTPRPEDLRSVFIKDGRTLPVHGVEKADAELLVVRDPASQAFFDLMMKGARRVSPTFGDDVRLYFLSPRPDRMLPEVVTNAVFPRSPRHPADGLLYLFQRERPLSFPVHLSDAVAIAGMTAQASHARRAVVLVLGGEPREASRYSAFQVREYLRRLRVPLYVWSMVSGARLPDWGDVRFAGTPELLVEAVAAVRRDLAAQRIVWLEGRHLPPSIELAAGDHGLRLATAPPVAAPPAASPAEADPPADPLPYVGDEGEMIELFTQPEGLVHGSHPVELSVVGPVEEVEVRLDDLTIGTVSEPWVLEADLGATLAPHRLVALARDREGRELERVERWLNVAPPAEGRTAVAVLVDPGATLPAPKAMGRWFLAGGEPARVVKVESGSAEVAIVRDPLIQPQLDALGTSFLVSRLSAADKANVARSWLGEGRQLWTVLETEDLAPSQAQLMRRVVRRLRDFASLGDDVTLSFLSPLAAPVSRVGSWRNLYNRAGPYTAYDGDFLELAQSISVSSAHRLSDALAVAAMELHGGGRRRAVIVLLGDERGDESLFTTGEVQAYLRVLQVPVFLWSATWKPPRPHPEWGEPRWVYSRNAKRPLANFESAAAEVRRHLEAQRVVHLAGRHLPQSIALTEEAVGLRLAGQESVRVEGGEP